MNEDQYCEFCHIKLPKSKKSTGSGGFTCWDHVSCFARKEVLDAEGFLGTLEPESDAAKHLKNMIFLAKDYLYG